METDQMSVVDLHKAFFQTLRDHDKRRATVGRTLYADSRRHHAVRRPVWGAGGRRGRSDDADVAFRRSNRRAGRARVRRGHAEDEAESRLRGEDRPARCASPGGCAEAGKRRQTYDPVCRRFASCANCAGIGCCSPRCALGCCNGRAPCCWAGTGDLPAKRLRSRAGQVWLDQLVLPAQAHRALTTMRQLDRDLTAQLGPVESEHRARSPRRSHRTAIANRVWHWPRPGPHAPRGNRRRQPLSDAGALGELCGRGPAGRQQCKPDPLRPDHERRIAVAAMGLGRSRHPDVTPPQYHGRWGRQLAVRKRAD